VCPPNKKIIHDAWDDYAPTTSPFALHLNTPSTQAQDKNRPKFLVDCPKLGPRPHEKCPFKIVFDDSKVDPNVFFWHKLKIQLQKTPKYNQPS
jgi:hypothetical protein